MKKFGVVEKQFNYKGHDCICAFTRRGIRTGYVSVKNYVDYDSVFELNIDCHGGLTFGGNLPSEYSPKEQYYIGFDCGHFGDGIDVIQAVKYELMTSSEAAIVSSTFGYPVRSLDFVEDECKRIVDQLEDLYKENDNVL